MNIIGTQDTTPTTIPVANPLAQTQSNDSQLLEAIKRVLYSGRYILGEEVECFEKEYATYIGTDYCIGVASGTDAIFLALKALDVGDKDEVITVSHTAVATVSAIEHTGAVPVFADIEPATRCMDPNAIPRLISDRTRAIVPVHVYGRPAPMVDILSIARKHGLRVVEDSAQAHGAEINGKKVGTFGDAGAFSFYPTKNLGAIGDGGAIVTQSSRMEKNLRLLREYGWKKRSISSISGFNSRLDEIQAAILRTKLPMLEENNKRRQEIAEMYMNAIQGKNISYPPERGDTTHAMHLFVVEIDERDAFINYMTEKGIQTAIHYPKAVHQQPAYKGKYHGSDNLPVTEALYKRIVSLPMYPEMTNHQIETVCSALRHWT